MLNSEQIIERIREDAPCVYDILHEIVWEYPIASDMLVALTEYNLYNPDVHYWKWRYAQMLEDSNRQPIRVPLNEATINDLQEWEHFHWTYDGVPLFIFNTDSTPQLDPDSDEYNPTITI